jgi:ParB family chromosome partitioning protein
MARRSGLGKGLGSLIPEGAVEGEVGQEPTFTELAIGSIVPNPHQPRVHFDEVTLGELAASIEQIGVLQPILVRPLDGGRYELVAGERRWRAAQRAGLRVIPAIVRTGTDESSIEQALVENLHRADLTPLEEAAAYQQLLEDFGLTHEQIAQRVGKSRSAVSNTLRLLGLPPAVQHLLADGKLSAGHARALLSTPDRALQEALARRAAAEGWSVRAVEDAVRPDLPDVADVPDEPAVPAPEPLVDLVPPSTPNAPIDGAGITGATRLRPPGLLELEGLLAAHLDTRVGVQMSAKRGRVTIDFADLADLERIYRRIIGEQD